MTHHIHSFNHIIRFLARRDLPSLTPDALFAHRRIRQADRLILMGGITTPAFAELAADAFHRGLAKALFVVGGAGHSTQNLRDTVASHPLYHSVPTAGRPEAAILCDILVKFLRIHPASILVEDQSTNCANNATLALQVARQRQSIPHSAIIIQDPLMQRRTHESFLHAWRAEPTLFDSFAPAIPLLALRDGALAFQDPAHHLYYKIPNFLPLLMGEIPRLRDDAQGYGPKGHALIGHVDIPDLVLQSFNSLLPQYSRQIRPRYTP